VLAGGLLALFAFGGTAATSLRTTLRGLIGKAHTINTDSVTRPG